MIVKQVMTPNVQVISPNATAREAASMMQYGDYGLIPVCDGTSIEGVLSDRDIVIRMVAKGLDPDQCKVGDIMSPDVIYAFDDQDVEDAAQIMQDCKVRRVLVMNHEKKLVGIVSIGDIAHRMRAEDITGATLGEISEPHFEASMQ